MNASGESDPLALRKANTLSTLVADKIEQSILTGDLGAGERINEVTLARELGVSRGPIREAARLLSNQGLVEFVANKGAFVRQVSRADMLEIYDLRAVLTGHACELAATNSDCDVMALRTLLDNMDAASRDDDADAYYALNLTFHDRLVESSGSKRLSTMTASLVKEAHLFRKLSLSSLQDMRTSNAEHVEIVEAIAARDPERARALGERHVRAGKARFEAAAET